MKSPLPPRRRLPAVQEIDALGRKGLTLMFDEWAEAVRAFVPPVDGVPWAGSVRCLPGQHRFDEGFGITRSHLVGEVIDPIQVATCPQGAAGSHRALPALQHAPFVEDGVFAQRPDVAASLLGGARSIRSAVVEALLGGVVGDDGVARARIGSYEGKRDERPTLVWS